MPSGRAIGYSDYYKGTNNNLDSTTRTPAKAATPAFKSRTDNEAEERRKKAIKRRLQMRTR